MRWFALALLVAMVALVPSSAYAQGDDEGKGLALRIDSPLNLPASESVDTAVVIGDDALIRGTVEDALLVIDGDAVVAGEVKDVVVISGSLELLGRANVAGDVRLIDSDITQAETATVSGEINEGWGVGWWWWIVSPVLFWVSLTIAVLLAGLVFAGIGGRQLRDAAHLLTHDPGWSILAAVLTVVLVPALAVVSMVTLIGIPFGIGLLLFLLPAIWFLGYIVTSTMLGELVLRGLGRTLTGERPYAAVLVGVLALQLVALIPFFGLLVAVLAGIWGAGGLVLLAWRGWKGPQAKPAPMPTV